MPENYLDKALSEYSHEDIYPFHMPGHKRELPPEIVPERIDITEIPGFDDLRHPESIIKEGQERLATLYGVPRSYYLINGSTAGNLASICACAKGGDVLLVSEGSHWSVQNGAFLAGLKVCDIPRKKTDIGIPGSVDPGEVGRALLGHPDAAAVVITSPTYEGVVSDIAAIADIVHAHGIPLIVDAAHGAHFGFHKIFPENAARLGADIAVESLHKTLPSFTQSSALFLCREEYVSHELMEKYLRIFQSSSPSYILMAGIDRCVRLLQEQGAERFGEFAKRLGRFYGGMAELKRIKLLAAPGDKTNGIWQRDISRILISGAECKEIGAENHKSAPGGSSGLSGAELERLLRKKYKIQIERDCGDYVIALSSVMDTDEGFSRLSAALLDMEKCEK